MVSTHQTQSADQCQNEFQMNNIIRQDLFRYIGTDCHKLRSRIRYILFTPGFQYIYCFRHASSARNPLSRLFWKVLLRRCMFHSGIQIPAGTHIGPGFRISHFGAIVINPAAQIGKNFSIAQGALIGSAEGKHKGIPVIGDNVIMSANSLIIGGGTCRRLHPARARRLCQFRRTGTFNRHRQSGTYYPV